MKTIYMTLYGPLETDARVQRSIEAAVQSGCQVVIVTCNTAQEYEPHGDTKLINLPYEGLGAWAYLKFCWLCLWHFIRDKKHIDVIYLQDYYSTIVGLLLLPFKGKRAVVYDAHELILPMPEEKLTRKEKLFDLAERQLIKFTDLVIQANKEREDIFKKAYPGVRTQNVMNISKVNATKGRVLNIEKIIIVYQGAMTEGRNLSFFIDAMPRMSENISLLMIGNGPNLEDYKEKVRSLGIEHRVEFTGRLSNVDMMNRMDACAIGIISYPFINYNNIYCSPNKIFEYAAISLPYIATEQPFLKEVGNKYHIGRTFKEGDIDSFVDNVSQLIEEYETYTNTSQFLEDYSYENEMKKMENIFVNI